MPPACLPPIVGWCLPVMGGRCLPPIVGWSLPPAAPGRGYPDEDSGCLVDRERWLTQRSTVHIRLLNQKEFVNVRWLSQKKAVNVRSFSVR